MSRNGSPDMAMLEKCVGAMLAPVREGCIEGGSPCQTVKDGPRRREKDGVLMDRTGQVKASAWARSGNSGVIGSRCRRKSEGLRLESSQDRSAREFYICKP